MLYSVYNKVTQFLTWSVEFSLRQSKYMVILPNTVKVGNLVGKIFSKHRDLKEIANDKYN